MESDHEGFDSKFQVVLDDQSELQEEPPAEEVRASLQGSTVNGQAVPRAVVAGGCLRGRYRGTPCAEGLGSQHGWG